VSSAEHGGAARALRRWRSGASLSPARRAARGARVQPRQAGAARVCSGSMASRASAACADRATGRRPLGPPPLSVAVTVASAGVGRLQRGSLHALCPMGGHARPRTVPSPLRAISTATPCDDSRWPDPRRRGFSRSCRHRAERHPGDDRHRGRQGWRADPRGRGHGAQHHERHGRGGHRVRRDGALSPTPASGERLPRGAELPGFA
jgi:hypothetical protein